MDDLIRSPRLIDDKRVLPLGGRVSALGVSGVGSSEKNNAFGGGSAAVVVQNVSEQMRKVAELERTSAALRQELSLANERLRSYDNDIEKEFDQARDNGFAAGKKQGNERAETDWRQKLDQLKSIIDSAARSRAQIAKANEDVIAEVVYAATLKIIGHEAASRASIRRVVAEAIGDVGNASVVQLRVARRDSEFVETLVAEMFGGTAACQVVVDDHVILGGCVMEQANGSLDARLETQLEALRRAVMKAYAGSDA